MPSFSGYAASSEAVANANRARAFGSNPEIESRVRAICEQVRLEGDAALLRQVQQFDCCELQLHQLKVSEAEIEAAWASTTAAQQGALRAASSNIEEFHRRQPAGGLAQPHA